MNYARRPGIDSERAAPARTRASATTFVATHAESARLARGQRRALAQRRADALDARLVDAASAVRARARAASRSKTSTATRYIDFCFGDTGAMFGHSPPAIARALAETGAAGITSMLPAERVARVGEKLAATVRPAVLADDADRDGREPRRVALGARDHGPRAHAGVRRLLSRHGRGDAGARAAGHEEKGGDARPRRPDRHERTTSARRRTPCRSTTSRRWSACWRAAARRRSSPSPS